jgi:hypothetical protein
VPIEYRDLVAAGGLEERRPVGLRAETIPVQA